jgi:hypothetical protein
MSVSVILFTQFLFALSLMVVIGTDNRKLWAPLFYEMYLVYYFIVYSKYQKNLNDGMHNSLFNMVYFSGLGLSVFGFLFDFVNEKKRIWIPKEAWYKQKEKDE